MSVIKSSYFGKGFNATTNKSINEQIAKPPVSVVSIETDNVPTL
jgi:hypothetical protein